MKDIELVIRIPEEVKHKIYSHGLSLCPSDKEQLIRAIMNGTPLPKGHGRLIDANTVDKSVKDPYQNREVMYWINNAPTIIEAESEESEDKE